MKIAVIGSGPAGLAAALSASRAGAEVSVFERMPSLSVKLRASGGGRCNISNTLPDSEYMKRFGRQGRFMQDALTAYPDSVLFEFLKKNGVSVSAQDGFHYFPDSGKASDVAECFRRNAETLGARFYSGLSVEEAESGFSLRLSSGKKISADALILACGGTAWPALGGTDAGLRLAEHFGHTIRKPYPAMAPLLIQESWVGAHSGVSLPNAELSFGKGRNAFRNQGELLFTHKGFSGPCALDLAGELSAMTDEKGPVPLLFRPDAALDIAFWRRKIEESRRNEGAKLVRSMLMQYFPRSLAIRFCQLAGAEESRFCDLKGEAREILIEMLGQGISLTAYGAGPMDCAMAMKGGVSLSEVNPKTLESRIVPRLYFAGEILDLVGPCGGYNIRWAFASGFLAGSSAAQLAAGERSASRRNSGR